MEQPASKKDDTSSTNSIPILRKLSFDEKKRFKIIDWSDPPIGPGGEEIKTNMQKALAIVTSQNKVISMDGWCSSKRSIDLEDEHIRCQFRRACWFLSNTKPCDKIYKKSTSYGLKHVAEHTFKLYYERADYYISNGVFILAMIYLGYAPEKLWKQKSIDDINVFAKIKSSSLPDPYHTISMLKYM